MDSRSAIDKELYGIVWNVSGKIQEVREKDSTLLRFYYDATGNRVKKEVWKYSMGGYNTRGKFTWYVRDAQGTVLGTYEKDYSALDTNMYLTEVPIYGSDRVGMGTPGQKRYAVAPDTLGKFGRYLDKKLYELKDHLGNVRVTISDIKILDKEFFAEMTSYSNYYPFGMLQPGRHWSTEEYRYGFGSHEKDDEIQGLGNHYSFGDYGYDPRIGRRWNIDPKFNEIAGVSPYSYALNNPIVYIDKNGKLPILPLLLKAGASGAADMLMQAAMAYYFDPEVESIDQAFEKVNWWQVSRATAEGLIPWGIPGGRIGKAAAAAAGDVVVNAIDAGSDYTQEQALQDFAVGFIGDLAGGGLGELIGKYGPKVVANGLLKMGFDAKYIRQITGGLSDVEAREWYLEQEASIPNLLDQSLSVEDQAKQAFNLRNKFRTEARELMEDQVKAKQIAAENPNFTWDDIVAKTKAKGFEGDDVYREIINSSQRSRKSVNEKLGVQPKK